MGDWQLTIVIPASMWMTANRDYGRTGYKQRMVTGLQQLAGLAARAANLPAMPDPCDLTWTIAYPKGVGPADAPNSYPTCKALLDGLVRAGYITDDNHRHVIHQTWVRGPNLTVKGRHQIMVTATKTEVNRG